MQKTRNQIFIVFLLLKLSYNYGCSMYKITHNNTTIVGCNEDAWRTTSKIWFENKNKDWLYNAAFTGSRYDGLNGFAPQSGMNEYGLCFSRLASHTNIKKDASFNYKKPITNPTQYLKNILHNCKTVYEVYNYIKKYDFSFFKDDVFIYIDKSGKYLIVEPHTLTIGNKSAYVLSNFCPTETPLEKANKLDRYRKGVAFLKNKTDNSLEFCTALSDTMHVCRPKIGDGTLLTSIWNTDKLNVTLYFYHDYKKGLMFNLTEEFKKGNHILNVSDLFPKNNEFIKLQNYKTPKNNLSIMLFIMLSGIYGLLFSIYFMIVSVKRKVLFKTISLLIFITGVFMFLYNLILATNINIFYFAAPYKDSFSTAITLSSFLPFFTVISFVLILVRMKKTILTILPPFTKICLYTLLFLQLLLIVFFIYWRLFF